MKQKIIRGQREKAIPEYKIQRVSMIVDAIKDNKTLLIASTHKLPSSQFHEIKKKLRGKASIYVAKKSLILRAIESSKAPGLSGIKELVGADIALFFSNLDPFALSGLLADNQSPAKAKAGDVALQDISVEPGPTDLVPGPAISELSGVGLKVAVEGGKLAIKQPATIVKAGEVIKENVASVLGKLNILPLKVGFEPVAAYDSGEQKVYTGIKIDKKTAIQELRDSIVRSKGFAVGITYLTSDTLRFILAKAALHEKAIQVVLNKTSVPASNSAEGGAV